MNSVKPVFKFQPPVDKATFPQSTCLLTISVGQEVHEGDKFAATIELVNSAFKRCIMLVDDSLQRHSMALDSQEPAECFYAASLQAGDAWLERNAQYYRQLKNLTQILRWDHWLNHPNYPTQTAAIQTKLATDPQYKNHLDATVDEFLRRYYLRLINSEHFNLARAQQLCWDYLLEECTALCLWSELNCQLEVYPGRRNLAMQATHQRFIIPNHGDILHPIAIKFKNRKQLKPQHLQPLQTQGATV